MAAEDAAAGLKSEEDAGVGGIGTMARVESEAGAVGLGSRTRVGAVGVGSVT
jgi:hypothetical protein